MKLLKSSCWLFIAVLILLLSSCATTYVTSTWKDQNYAKPVQKVLVIGLGESQSRRRIFEDTLSKEFIRYGKKAIASAKFFPDVEKISKETVLPYVQENNIDAVIVVRLIAVNKEQNYVPASYPTHYNTFYGYYGSVGRGYYEPGYVVEDTLVSLEVNLYETDGAKLIWAITTESFNPENVNEEITKLTTLIIQSLDKEGLLKR